MTTTGSYRTTSEGPLFSPRDNTLPVRNLRRQFSAGQLFWREVGRGEVVIFLHGSWTNGDQWEGILQQLGHEYHCLAPDLLGFGESSRVDQSAYSIELEVDCLAEWLTSLRVNRVCLVGHSLGAWIATRYALRYPDQVKRLTLLEPEGLDLPNLKGRWRPYKYWDNRLAGLWLSLTRPLMGLLGQKTRWLRQQHLRQQLLRQATACRLLFRRRHAALQAEWLNTQLHDLAAPTLVIQGEHAGPVSAALSTAFVKATPQAQLRAIAGQDDLPDTASAELAQVIRQFMTEPMT